MTKMTRKTGRRKTGKAKVRRLIYFTQDNLHWIELRATKRNISDGEFLNLLVESARTVEKLGAKIP